MTQNQIRYQELQHKKEYDTAQIQLGRDTLTESTRHNVAGEKETARHDVVTENETARHNVATEVNDMNKLAETGRHNIVTEGETARHNYVSEGLSEFHEREVARHNIASEAINWADVGVRQQQANTQQFNATTQRMQYSEEARRNRVSEQQRQKEIGISESRYWNEYYDVSKKHQEKAEELEIANYNAESQRIQAEASKWNAGGKLMNTAFDLGTKIAPLVISGGMVSVPIVP